MKKRELTSPFSPDGGIMEKFHAVLYVGDGTTAPDVPEIAEHPADVTHVKESMPDGSYKIKPLREIINKGLMLPQFGEARVFVFRDFGEMSETCQNALLKFIEEPGEHNRFVMTAASSGRILSTILSRVVTVRVGSSETSGGGETVSPEVRETAQKAVQALLRGSEYDAAAALCKIKDRQTLSDVLQCVLDELFEKIKSTSEKKYIDMADVVTKYIKRFDETNPNISITVSACIAEMYSTTIGDN